MDPLINEKGLPLVSSEQVISNITQGGIHVDFEGDLRRKPKSFLAQRRTGQGRKDSGASRFFYDGATGTDIP